MALSLFSGGAQAEDGPGTQREISDMIPGEHESSATARDNNWAVLPEAGYSPDQRFNGGFKFTGRDLSDHDLTIDLEVNVAMEHQLGADATIVSPELLDRRALNLDEYHYYLRLMTDFCEREPSPTARTLPSMGCRLG